MTPPKLISCKFSRSYQILVETMFLRYKKQTQKKRKTLRDKTSKRAHVNFRRKNSCYFKFFIIVGILLHSEPLPGQVFQQYLRKLWIRLCHDINSVFAYWTKWKGNTTFYIFPLGILQMQIVYLLVKKYFACS